MAKPSPIESFCDEARQAGALDAVVVSPQRQVFTATWVRLRCQYGCSEYGQCLTCPPYSPTPETTRRMLDEYRSAILLHGANYSVVSDNRNPGSIYREDCYRCLQREVERLWHERQGIAIW